MTGTLGAYFVGGSESGYNSLRKNHSCLDLIIPTWLELNSEGSLKVNISQEEKRLVNNYNNTDIIPLIQNSGLKSEVSNQIIKNSDNWARICSQCVDFLESYGYQKLNFDIEGVKSRYREIFSEFIDFLIGELKKYGYRVSLSLPAKTDNNGNLSWTGAYDYEKLGSTVDRIIIMAYDYHWAGGPPGAIAPLFWVQDVLDYTIMQIPPQKLYLGIPCYGYDWDVNEDYKKRARGLSYTGVMNLKNKYQRQVQWDQESQSPYFKYNNHEIWFENAASIEKKLDMVEKYQLAGAVFWRLGLEDPGLWKKI